jgi:hypothetical protein
MYCHVRVHVRAAAHVYAGDSDRERKLAVTQLCF